MIAAIHTYDSWWWDLLIVRVASVEEFSWTSAEVVVFVFSLGPVKFLRVVEIFQVGTY